MNGRRLLAAFASCAALVLPLEASARSSAKLAYARDAGATSCPDEDTLRTAVAARLGYDPFQSADERTVRAQIRRPRGGRYSASIDLVDAAGSVLGHRELSSNSAECDELFLAMTLAIAIAIDPMHAAPSPAPASSAPRDVPIVQIGDEKRAPVSIAVPDRAANEAAAPPPPRLFLRPMLGFLGGAGLLPGPSFGLFASFGVERRSLSVAVEGRWDAPRSHDGPRGGSVTATIASGALVPCFHADPWLACAAVSLGAALGSGSNVPHTRDAATIFSMAGLRVGVEPRLSEHARFHAHVEADGVVTPTTLSINGAEAWTGPPVALTLAFGLLAEL